MATYAYDEWGNCTVQVLAADSNGHAADSPDHIAQVNPFRYRGYYYDNETGFYYLNSRYYDPETGRFLNADGELAGVGSSTLGYDVFLYCFNNPINLNDQAGNWPKWATGAFYAVSGALQMAAGAALGATAGWTGFGAVVAGFLIVNGAATVAQGVGQIVNDVTKSTVMREDNIVRTGVTSIGRAIGGTTGEKVAGGVYDTAVMAANMYAGASAKAPSACFVAGTAVLTSAGLIAIENVTSGDMVWSENPETGEKELKQVLQTFINETDELVHLYVNGEEIVTTPEHPFYVPNQGWTEAIQLRAGDILVLQNGTYVIVEKIQHEILEAPVKVYNFEVADFHTYFVGASGILVHNACSKFTPDQQAVIQLAKEYKNGVSKSDADILVGWAKEYGINTHEPTIHPNRGGIWSYTEHIKIFNEHIPIK